MPESYVRIVGSITPEAGSAISFSKNPECDAVARTEAEVAALAADYEVAVSPLADPANAVGLIIIADSYPETVPGTPDLSVKVHLNTEAEIPLSGPLFIDGAVFGAMGAAGVAPDSLFFSNAHATTDVIVTVLVAYNVL